MIVEAELRQMVDDAGYRDDGVIAVAVVNDDGSIASHARGVLLDGRPMSATMQLYGASLTKQVVGTCIARLVNDGRLDPDQPVATWFPNLPGWANEVCVRHLLHHTAGLPDEDPLKERMRELGLAHRTNEAMLAAVATFPSLVSTPGDEHRYANVGYVMLARIVEIITGALLVAYARESIFTPLQMVQSQLWAGPERNPAGANPLVPDVPTPHSVGDGGMWTTADDLTRWIVAMNADAFGTRTRMMAGTTLNDGAPCDYAWGIVISREHGTAICSHGGGWPGSYSLMSWMPERGSGFIALTITGGEPLENVSAALRNRLTA
jgi:CubicO group peptidase (beta-lactamase class C family)